MARNFTWLSLQELLVRLIGLAIAVYLARTLSPSSFGALGLALAIVGIVCTLVQVGTGYRATRLTALNPDLVPEIYSQTSGMRIVASTVAMLCLFALTPVLATTFSIPPALLILASFLLLRPALIVAWAFRGLDQMQVDTIANVAERAIVLLGLVLLVRGQGNDVLWAPVVDVVAALLIVWWMRHRLGQIYPVLAIKFTFRDWPEISREVMPLSIASMIGAIYLHGGVLMLGWLDSSESAANFLVAQKIMMTFPMLLLVINKSAFPSISRLLVNNASQALELLARLLRYYLLLIIPLFLLITFYAQEILALIFGAEYANAKSVLIILLAALPFLAVSQSLHHLLLATPKPRAVLLSMAVAVMVLFLTALILIPRFSASGAALAVVASEVVRMLLLALLVKRALGGVPWNTRCYAPLVAGALAALVFAISDPWPFFVSLPLAIIVYVGAGLLMNAITMDELKSLPNVFFAATARNVTKRKPQEKGIDQITENESWRL